MNNIGLDCSALDPSFKEHAQRGIGRYVRELTRFFDSYEQDTPRVGRFDHRELRGGMIDSIVEWSPLGRQTLRQQVIYPLRLSGKRLGHFDVLHFPAHMDAPAWTQKPYVLTVLDLIPLVLPDLYKADRPSWRFSLARWLEIRAISKAALILAISENTARDVSRVLGVSRDRIVVTPLGVDEKFLKTFRDERSRSCEVFHRLHIPKERQVILYVGGIDPRKNVGFMLDVFAELKARRSIEGRACPVIMCVGRISQDRQFPAFMKKRETLGLEKDVILGGFVTDEELLSLYASSDVFFFPSLYEGFGLPVLEAMAAGLPVVSSNASSMPEVLGDTGLMFDPSDLKQAVNALDAALRAEETGRDRRFSAHERAKGFTWETTGTATLNAYRVILDRLGIQPGHSPIPIPINQPESRTDRYGTRRDVAF